MPGTPETLFVFDANCPVTGDQSIIHDAIYPDGNITPVTFKRNQPTELPYAVAMRFINRDPAWTAYETADRKGKVEPRGRAQHDPTLPVQLKAHEAIAAFDELTQEALIARAVALPGGEGFSKQTKKTELVDFLTRHGQARIRQRNIDDGLIVEPRRRAPAVESDEIEDPEELNRMFGEEAA